MELIKSSKKVRTKEILLKIENCRSDKSLKYQQISDHFQRPLFKKSIFINN